MRGEQFEPSSVSLRKLKGQRVPVRGAVLCNGRKEGYTKEENIVQKKRGYLHLKRKIRGQRLSSDHSSSHKQASIWRVFCDDLLREGVNDSFNAFTAGNTLQQKPGQRLVCCPGRFRPQLPARRFCACSSLVSAVPGQVCRGGSSRVTLLPAEEGRAKIPQERAAACFSWKILILLFLQVCFPPVRSGLHNRRGAEPQPMERKEYRPGCGGVIKVFSLVCDTF